MDDYMIMILASGAFGLFAGMVITSFADGRIIRELKSKLADSENAPEIIEIRDERNQEEDPFKPW